MSHTVAAQDSTTVWQQLMTPQLLLIDSWYVPDAAIDTITVHMPCLQYFHKTAADSC